MAKTSRYGQAEHQRAFRLWAEKGLSFRAIAKEDDMPSRTEIAKWSKDYGCPDNCPWHNWKQLKGQIIDKAAKEAGLDLSEEGLVELEKERLEFLIGLEADLTNRLESGNLEPPKTMNEALNLLERVYNQERLIRGESTSIAEIREPDSKPSLSLTKIAKQLNLGSPEELIRAVEEATLEN